MDNSGTDKLSKVALGENYSSRAQHARRVQGHWVKYWNCNNNASDISIVFKFGTEFQHVTGDTLQMFKVKCCKSRSQCKVMYQQQKAMDGFSDNKLGITS